MNELCGCADCQAWRLLGSPRPPPVAKTVGERLADLGRLKDERGRVYGDEYKRFGRICKAIWPEGLNLQTEEEFNRFGLYVFMLAKLSRYGQNMKRGGHVDSLDDISVYAQMCQECDEMFGKEGK